MTSLDLLATLRDTRAISATDFGEALTRIRKAGLTLIPHGEDELLALISAAPVVDAVVWETAELRAIREAVLRVRMTDVLQLPKEQGWIDGLTRALIGAIEAQWTDEIPASDANARSNWLMALLDVHGWSHRIPEQVDDQLARYRAQLLMLMILPDASEEVRERYWQWLEKAVLTRVRDEDPQTYTALLNTVEGIITEGPQRDPEVSAANIPRIVKAVAIELFMMFPPKVRDSLASSSTFRDRYDLEAEAIISIGTSGTSEISFQRSTFYGAIRGLYSDSSVSINLKLRDGGDCRLSMENNGGSKVVVINLQGRTVILPPFWALSRMRSIA